MQNEMRKTLLEKQSKKILALNAEAGIMSAIALFFVFLFLWMLLGNAAQAFFAFLCLLGAGLASRRSSHASETAKMLKVASFLTSKAPEDEKAEKAKFN